MAEAINLKRYWLLKAEPDSRVVKGKDVKVQFGIPSPLKDAFYLPIVDDFERVNTAPWDGVRNYEARNLMKEMKVGEKVLFYHSNCKNPGITAFAQVAKEAYPDHTAWDTAHPYYDPKSNPEKPKWFMVDLTFSSRTKHFIPLSLLRFLSNASLEDLPQELKYIEDHGLNTIKSMDLITRGRLSVQRVNEDAWNVILNMSDKGGWEGLDLNQKGSSTKATKPKRGHSKNEASHTNINSAKNKGQNEDGDGDVEFTGPETGRKEICSDEKPVPKKTVRAAKRKREVEDVGNATSGSRKSTRTRK